MQLNPAPAAALLAAILTGCGGGTGPGASYDPPTTEFAAKLGIEAPPPVTEDEAKAIAAEAAGGTATSVSSETEDGQLIYEVQVRTPDGDMEVEVFASNGGVAEIEPAD
jgi:uncharacterized membrane protein YkoI